MGVKMHVLACIMWVLLEHFQAANSEDGVRINYGDTAVCLSESTWAVNTPLLNVTHTVETAEANIEKLTYKLTERSNNCTIICEYTIYIQPGQCVVSATPNNCVNCILNKDVSPHVLTVVFTISDIDDAKNQSKLTYSQFSKEIDDQQIQEFTVSACESPITQNTLNQNSSFTITSDSISAGFSDEGACRCPEEELVYMNGKEVNATATCMANAQWVGCENVQCWSGPQVHTTEQLNTTVGASHPFKCNFTEGFPNSTNILFKINGTKIPGDYLLMSSDHGKNLSCEVVSNFTIAVDVPYESEPRTIEVYFPPENSHVSKDSLVIKVNNSKLLNYSVFANPEYGDINVTVNKEPGQNFEASADFTMICNYTEVTHHIYMFNITVSSDGEYGSYQVCAKTTIPAGTNCDQLSICNAPAPTTSQPDTASFSVTTGTQESEGHVQGIPASVIGAIVASAILLILIIVAVVALCKRRERASNKDNAKEEKVNELYGSTQYQAPSMENPESVKQEKPNVLYGSASGGASGDVVEYTMADRDCIVSDDVVQYATTNPDAGNDDMVVMTTSAAEQPCSSNAAIYAQVNKKKGNVNDGYNVEIHDSKPDASADTYTVIDKSKKRNKDDVPEVYAVVNKPRTKG